MRIEKLDNQGRGITFVDGVITFVEDALPLEDVEIEITEKNKKYNIAKVIKRNNSSDMRVEPKCPFYHECGGCNLMHMDSSYQSEFKIQKIKDILKKYAGIDTEVTFIKSDKDLYYRNKIELKVHNNTYAYYNSESHDRVDIAKCLLASDAINEIVDYHSFMDIKNGDITIRSNSDNELLIVVKCDRFEFFNDPPSNVKGVVVNDKIVYGNNFFFDTIGDYKFKVSYTAFFQINNYIANEIFNILKENIKGNNLLDLYCGSGVIGIALKDNINKIIGIEINKNSILDANDNAILNRVNNYKYYVGDTSEVLPTIKDDIDVVIVDPPRSGLNSKTLDDILKISPNQIGYISCDPMTLARDINILKDYYNIKKVYALDMFPNTFHVETVCILKLREDV